MDYYSILEVDRSASQEEIKRSYKKLAMKHHPDRGGDTEKLSKINEAYNVLKDPQKRSQYDNPQPQFNFHHNAGVDINDIFSSVFGFNNQTVKKRNRDIQIKYGITLKECYTGKRTVVSYNLPSGKKETIELEIPPNIKPNDIIKIDGYGDDSYSDLPRGSLILRVQVFRDPKWSIEGIDLLTVKTLNVFDLLTGTKIDINTPDDKKISLTIKPGTQPETILSLPGYGLHDMNSKTTGKIFVKIKAEIPAIDDKKTIELIEQIKERIA